MKLEVGMYVRTKYGYIAKLIDVDYEDEYYEFDKGIVWFYDNLKDIFDFEDEDLKQITKASHNIIDLIKEGDYVNGLRVEKNKYGELYTSYVYYGGDIGKQCEVYTNWLKEFKEDMIYNIVTKEQFEQKSYKVDG